MDIKNAENKLDQADSFLTKLKTVLKKHWGILLILAALAATYFVITSDSEVTDDPYYDEYYDEGGYDDEEYYDEEY